MKIISQICVSIVVAVLLSSCGLGLPLIHTGPGTGTSTDTDTSYTSVNTLSNLPVSISAHNATYLDVFFQIATQLKLTLSISWQVSNQIGDELVSLDVKQTPAREVLDGLCYDEPRNQCKWSIDGKFLVVEAVK